LVRYWTTRYLITLIVGLALLGAGSMWWIKQSTLDKNLRILRYLAVDMADMITFTSTGGRDRFERGFGDRARAFEMEMEPEIFVADLEGNLVESRTGRPGPMHGKQNGFRLSELPSEVLDNEDAFTKLKLNGMDYYAVKAPLVAENGSQLGWVVVMQTSEELSDVNQEYRLLAILLMGLGLLRWGVIYYLLKQILKPIQEVSRAAAHVRDGDYEVMLNTDADEKEIYELVTSFKEMTSRLIQLEQLRAELLAGVTHDLKTPVTSISGLVQAVRDGIVTGEESKEFLDITLKEIERLQSMISDLLDFNSLAAGAFTIRTENCEMNKLVSDIVRQWQIARPDNAGGKESQIKINVDTPQKSVYMDTDPLRLQQIMINLLNNADHAMDGEGTITVILREGGIDVRDTGSGIPEAEQPYIFERFFRGEAKKLKVRGLGLGLPFSRMLAKGLGVELILKESSEEGSTFSIVWNR
jgi:signal transduction histidine kinase